MKALELLRMYQYADNCLNGLMGVALNEAITELEALQAKIKELEAPKTCDGCNFLVHFGVKNSNRIVCDYPFVCIRRSKNEDYYTPKDKL